MIGRFSLWKHFEEAEAAWSPEALAREHLDLQKRYGLDFIKFSPHLRVFVGIFNPAGERKEMGSVGSVDAGRGNRYLDLYLGALRLIVESAGVPVLTTLFSSSTTVRSIVGEEAFAEALESGGGELFEAAARVNDGIIGLADRIRDLGVGVFFASKINGIEDYSQFLRQDLDVVSMFGERIYHIHDYSNAVGSVIKGLPDLALSWESARIQLGDIGSKVPVNGISRSQVQEGDFDGIRQDIEHLLSARRDAIIGPNCAIHDPIPEGGLGRVRDIARAALKAHGQE